MTQTIEQLTARVRELEEDNARLKLMEESALKVCGQLDEVVIALPFDYLDPPDGGDVSLGEQVKRMYSEVKTLRQQLAAQAATIKQMREALNHHHEIGLGRGRDKSNSLSQLIISGYKAGPLCRITEQALSIPDNSTEVLHQWLDSVTTAPSAYIVIDDENCEELVFPAAIFKYKMISEENIIDALYRKPEIKP